MSQKYYEWSSYNEYLGNRRLIDAEEVLGMFSDNHHLATQEKQVGRGYCFSFILL
jgi:hypothetical protein